MIIPALDTVLEELHKLTLTVATLKYIHNIMDTELETVYGTKGTGEGRMEEVTSTHTEEATATPTEDVATTETEVDIHEQAEEGTLIHTEQVVHTQTEDSNLTKSEEAVHKQTVEFTVTEIEEITSTHREVTLIQDSPSSVESNCVDEDTDVLSFSSVPVQIHTQDTLHCPFSGTHPSTVTQETVFPLLESPQYKELNIGHHQHTALHHCLENTHELILPSSSQSLLQATEDSCLPHHSPMDHSQIEIFASSTSAEEDICNHESESRTEMEHFNGTITDSQNMDTSQSGEGTVLPVSTTEENAITNQFPHTLSPTVPHPNLEMIPEIKKLSKSARRRRRRKLQKLRRMERTQEEMEEGGREEGNSDMEETDSGERKTEDWNSIVEEAEEEMKDMILVIEDNTGITHTNIDVEVPEVDNQQNPVVQPNFDMSLNPDSPAPILDRLTKFRRSSKRKKQKRVGELEKSKIPSLVSSSDNLEDVDEEEEEEDTSRDNKSDINTDLVSVKKDSVSLLSLPDTEGQGVIPDVNQEEVSVESVDTLKEIIAHDHKTTIERIQKLKKVIEEEIGHFEMEKCGCRSSPLDKTVVSTVGGISFPLQVSIHNTESGAYTGTYSEDMEDIFEEESYESDSTICNHTNETSSEDIHTDAKETSPCRLKDVIPDTIEASLSNKDCDSGFEGSPEKENRREFVELTPIKETLQIKHGHIQTSLSTNIERTKMYDTECQDSYLENSNYQIKEDTAVEDSSVKRKKSFKDDTGTMRHVPVSANGERKKNADRNVSTDKVNSQTYKIRFKVKLEHGTKDCAEKPVVVPSLFNFFKNYIEVH